MAQQEASRLIMYFDSVADALAMGGHGVFVWGAYGISFVIIFFVLLRPVMSVSYTHLTLPTIRSG